MKKLNKILIECLNQGMVLDDIEKGLIESALTLSEFKPRLAAKVLGITVPVMSKKMESYGLKPNTNRRGRSIPLHRLSPLGQLLREARHKKNYALKTVAYEIGHAYPDYISKVELGIKVPKKPMMMKIAAVLNLPPSVLEKAMEEAV